jgi:GH35 family endo-1,4-beta-xylanase
VPVDISGRDLPLHSSGEAMGSTWVLHESGFAGVFLHLGAAGRMHLSINASAEGGGGQPAPQLQLAIADQVRSFKVSASPAEYDFEVVLPAGTHFVRLDDVSPAPGAGGELRLHSLRIAGVDVLREVSDRIALAAANTFIQNYRKARVRVRLHGASPGDSVQIKLTRHAFDFGVEIPGKQSRLLVAQAPAGSEAARYQNLVLAHFNTVVLSEGGAWLSQEEQRGRVELGEVDRFLAFARDNALHARMHALLWDGDREPPWVSSKDPQHPGLLTLAAAGDATAKQALLGSIHERIDDLVRKRAAGYQALEVLNESLHHRRYWQAFGAEGIAGIFNDTAQAVRSAGAQTKLYLNEYGLFQRSTDPASESADPFANWYRWHAEELRHAGAALDGLGVQYEADGRGAADLGEDVHRPARIFAVLQNLSGTGLQLALSEFAVPARPGVTPERSAEILDDTLRLVFGTPAASAALLWSVWAGAAGHPVPASVLYDERWAPTAAGRRFEALMKEWDTNLSAPLGEDGSLEFAGYFGAYRIQSGGRSACLSLRKGQTDYDVDLGAERAAGGVRAHCTEL